MRQLSTLSKWLANFWASSTECRSSQKLLSWYVYALLFPCRLSSATAERSFSTLRRLKTFTRLTMKANRLTHLALLHVHQDRTDRLNLNDLCTTFCEQQWTQTECISQIDSRHLLSTVFCYSPFGLIGHLIEQAVIASDLNKTKFLRPRPDQQDQSE